MAGTTSNKRASKQTTTGAPKLLSGGKPQIVESEGDAPAQACIAAMPGCKRRERT